MSGQEQYWVGPLDPISAINHYLISYGVGHEATPVDGDEGLVSVARDDAGFSEVYRIDELREALSHCSSSDEVRDVLIRSDLAE